MTGSKVRLLRKFGAVFGAVALAVTALSGVANAAAPTASYDAFTINGAHSYTFDTSNATISMIVGDRTHFDLSAYANGIEQRAFVTVVAPTAQTIGIGTFPIAGSSDATHYRLDIVAGNTRCIEMNGSLAIHALTFDPATNEITSIAASYWTDCNGWHGEIRWHSDMPFVEAVQTPNDISFGRVDLGHSSQVQTVTITSSGMSALKLGAASIGGDTPEAFTITSNTCTNATLEYRQSCAIGVRARPTGPVEQHATLTVLDNSRSGKRTIGLGLSGHLGVEGTYVPVNPTRLLDTREGNGAPKAPLGGGKTLHLQVTGRGGVPSSKVSAVVLNVTVTGPTSAGYLTVYPSGIARPTASSLNFPAGWTGANGVTVPVGTNGQVDIYNAAGNTHVIADVQGYYYSYDDTQTLWTAGQYWPTQPERLLDSRAPAFGGPLNPWEYVEIPVSYGAAYDVHIRALAVNITAVSPTMSGYVTAWNGLAERPKASTLNFTPGSVVPNFAVVPTSWCFTCGAKGAPSIGVGNFSSGRTHIVVDIFGFYDDGQIPGGLRFHPLTPTRIVDTRDGLGARTFTGAGTSTVAAPSAVASDNTYALVANVTGVDPVNSTYLSLWATGDTKPTVSNLNLTPHEVRPNAAFVNLGPGNKFNVFNAAWKVDVVIDVSGTFEFLPGSVPSAQSSSLVRQGPLHSSSTGTPQRQPMR
ncbi:choice-of-anchor D domain-containing protein [Dactylosporangium sp. NPDC005572]|uniref:choice-of-anchor D domain-containing protein n=1 Tax=Dactylosporangium sp. NPDC005572 TaxID=3156889 RepID=UPI0033B11317